MKRRIGIFWSGGGGKGRFQAGAARVIAERVEAMGDEVVFNAGISVGAFTGAAYSMGKLDMLDEFWLKVDNRVMKTTSLLNRPVFQAVSRLLRGKRGLLPREPLEELVRAHIHVSAFKIPFSCGAVNLGSGELVYLGYPDFVSDEALQGHVLSSAIMPAVWEPVEGWVDGGVRDNSPIGEVLKHYVDVVVIVNTSPKRVKREKRSKWSIMQAIARSFEIGFNEVVRDDIETFLTLNSLAHQAAKKGVELTHPKSGKKLKYYDYILIEPNGSLGSPLDFENYWQYLHGQSVAEHAFANYIRSKG